MKKHFYLLLCFSFSCINADVTTEKVDSEQLAADLISASNDYQQAYITKIGIQLVNGFHQIWELQFIIQMDQHLLLKTNNKLQYNQGMGFWHLKCQISSFMSSDMNTLLLHLMRMAH